MDRDIVARVEDWEPRPYAGGYAGLRDLAAADFSGAVGADGAWLFMLNGRIVGVLDGTMAAFEAADGTAYEAPHPSLPLLFAMRETGGETHGRYYTDDTPLSEVDETLSSGFTGYLELSENVLSGDYYVVYYGGRSMSVAFIGNEERLVTGTEAFELADDEVGIYEVVSVELDVQTVPDPEPEPEPAPGSEPEPTPEPDPTADRPDEPATDRPREADVDADPSPDDGGATEPEPATDRPTGGQTADPAPDDPADAAADRSVPDETTPATDAEHGTADEPDEDPFSEEAEWRKTRTVPALDPEQTEVDAETEPEPTGEAGREVADPGAAGQPRAAAAQSSPDADAGAADRIRELEAELESRIETIERLQERLDETEAEREILEEERNRLERRVEQLQSSGADEFVGSAREREMDPESALDRTDLFVRYGSKGKATLEKAHDGEATKEEVNDNLRLEEHTRFETDDVAVAGRPFEKFLADTLEYRFVKWVVEDFLYEIQDTDSSGALRDLYDALPLIDRAAFTDTVTMRDQEGNEHTETFDVVLRDRMGRPLLVANLNDARDPATGDMMEDLVERATAVADGHDPLSAAFLVTASFFAPDALETATAAAGGGFLNRESKRSYVKLSRKRGFHLCLVEARRDEFHVAVPEL